MDIERIFLRKLEDIRKRVGAPWQQGDDAEYELLMIAPLLREMLFGSPTLIHPANREHRLDIGFRFVELRPLPPNLPQAALFVLGNLPIDEYPDHLISTFSLDRFLSAPVAHVGGTPVTVKDVVDYAANAAGGVHIGDMTRGRRTQVRKIDEMLRIDGWSVMYVLLARVGTVVVEALEPLAEKVRADYST